MRKTLGTRPHPRRAATVLTGLALITTAALAGCSGSGSSSAVNGTAAEPASAPVAAAPAAGLGERAAGSAGSAGSAERGAAGPSAGTAKLAAAGQQLIYTAQLTVRAGDVATAVSRATSIVTAAGGYVSAENASTDPAHPDRSVATVELKIPAAAYQATLARLTGTALGTQLALRQQAQDVTQQVADVSSRVASDQAAISQLRRLLKQAGSIADLLSVQNQIDSQTSDLESLLAQQRALDREIAYATVTVTITGPKTPAKPRPKPVPPPGLGNGLSGGWHAFRLTIDWLLAVLGAIAPFAAAIAVVGGVAWWGRERLRRRLSRRPPAG